MYNIDIHYTCMQRIEIRYRSQSMIVASSVHSSVFSFRVAHAPARLRATIGIYVADS